MTKFLFELVSPEKLLFSGDAEAVVIPGSSGQMTILQGHASSMLTLDAGLVEIDEGAGKKQSLFVFGGFADVKADKLTILAERALSAESLNGTRLQAEIETLETSIAQEQNAAARADQERALYILHHLHGGAGSLSH